MAEACLKILKTLNESKYMTEHSLTETLYTPESQLRHPILFLRQMWADLKASRGLAWRLMIRDISAMYRQTALGYFWAVFPPLVTSLVFILLKGSAVMDVSTSKVPYPVYVFTGMIFWQLFVDALNAPLKVATESKAILSKINFPRESFILSGIGQVLFSFTIKIVLLVGVLLLYQVPVRWTVIFLPVPLLGLLLLGTMIGILLMPVGLLYKDVQSALLIATSALVFITPVGYPPDVSGLMGALIRLNPVTPALMTAKELAFEGMPVHLIPFLWIFGATFLLLFIGWVIYRLAIPIIIERIGA
jgi:lipopolysaccharide transport system permease protein